MSIEIFPTKPPPINHLVVVLVPPEFSKIIVEGGKRDNRLFADQLLHLAQVGAECRRLHQSKESHIKRKRPGAILRRAREERR